MVDPRDRVQLDLILGKGNKLSIEKKTKIKVVFTINLIAQRDIKKVMEKVRLPKLGYIGIPVIHTFWDIASVKLGCWDIHVEFGILGK